VSPYLKNKLVLFVLGRWSELTVGLK